MRNNRKVSSALALFPGPTSRDWHCFEDLVGHITAWELDDVISALNEAEQATKNGYWVAGMVAYDAGPALDSAIQSHRNPDVPLVAFGVFENPSITKVPTGGLYEVSSWDPSQSQSEFERSVRTIKDPIRRGDSYQVNHTMRLRARFMGDPQGFFARIARAQQAKYSAYIDLGNAAVCSASPELLFRRDADTITTGPMKGTRPRGPDPATDKALSVELTTSEKDRAENTMIVDMARNDLSRIADIGSVEVPGLHSVETYPTLHQMTSTVTAKTNASLADTFRALFPAASITGAPKFSTSELITTFEPSPRGVYTGAVGVMSPHGCAEFNVAIRTAWIDRTTATAEYGVGCGIVWDSDPTAEWLEARQKTAVLRRCQTDFRLLETMRWTPSRGISRLESHIERLASAANHFGFECETGEIRNKLREIAGSSDLRVRLLVDEFGTPEIELTPLNSLDNTNSSDRVPPESNALLPLVGLDSEPVDPTNEFLYHKTTDRRLYNAARTRQSTRLGLTDADIVPDVLLWNTRGELTESSIGNIVVEVDGRLITPPLQSGLLPGTFRQQILDNGLATESTIDLSTLRNADRVFIVNSVRAWTEVTVDFSYIPDELQHNPTRQG